MVPLLQESFSKKQTFRFSIELTGERSLIDVRGSVRKMGSGDIST